MKKRASFSRSSSVSLGSFRMLFWRAKTARRISGWNLGKMYLAGMYCRQKPFSSSVCEMQMPALKCSLSECRMCRKAQLLPVRRLPMATTVPSSFMASGLNSRRRGILVVTYLSVTRRGIFLPVARPLTPLLPHSLARGSEESWPGMCPSSSLSDSEGRAALAFAALALALALA
jgi:hypothetical protein